MQSIIVYRNPLEAMFWENFDGAAVFPVIAGIVVFFVALLVLNAFFDHLLVRAFSWVQRKLKNRYSPWAASRWAANTELAIAAVAGCAMIGHLI